MSIGRKIARLDESIGSTLPDFDNISAKIIKFLQILRWRGTEERFLQILNMHHHFDRIACHKLVFASHWMFATLPFKPTLLSGHHRSGLLRGPGFGSVLSRTRNVSSSNGSFYAKSLVTLFT